MLCLAPAEDAELLRETTARFLAQTCDLTVVREWATTRGVSLWTGGRRGAQLGLDLSVDP